MSRFNKNEEQGKGFGSMVAAVGGVITGQGSELINQSTSKQVASMESLSAADASSAQAQFKQVEQEIRTVAEEAGIEVSDVGLEAASIAMMGLGDGGAYHDAAIANQGSKAGFEFIGSGIETASMESFDRSSIGEFANYSTIYNLLAPVQDSFAAAFFKTIVLTPDHSGIDVSVEQTVIFNEVKRSIDGSVVDFSKQRLIDAVSDGAILAGDSTKLYPVLAADDSNDKFFVASGDVAPESVELSDGSTIRTAPLKVETSVDLLALASGAVAGQNFTDEDSIDPRVALDRLYIKVTDANGGSPKTSVVAIRVNGLPKSQFYKSAEGKSREMTLSYTNDAHELTADTQDVSGAAGEAFARFATAQVRFEIAANGSLNVETGAAKVYGPAPSFAAAYNAEGIKLATDSGIGQTLLDDLSFEFLGYNVDAYHSNANLRHRGQLVDSEVINECYGLDFTPPFTAKEPVNAEQKRSATDLKALIRATRTYNQNNAVQVIVDHAAMLEEYVDAVKGNKPVPAIQGAGRHLVSPFFMRVPLDVAAAINSTKSHERASDVNQVLINTINSIAYPMAQESSYTTALEQISNGTETKPTLVIGTDEVIQRHLMIEGDDRTASIGFTHNIVTSPNKLVKNKIFLTFTRQSGDEADPLSFGVYGFVPELVSKAQVTRGGSTVKVTTVQGRMRHAPMLPVMAVIEVSNLQIALKDKV